ncbi:MAG: patatin-like phospholipase family protein [Flavobacteriaceae bacterium]|nr:patatin-like phospholipase family protein [Flavobacteriaceae bacterium]
MKGLVISGGGSKGAFAGGVAQFLIEELGRDYQILVGTSTGSLLVPHLALNEIEKIKKAYTSVTMDDIFSHRPFTIKRSKYGDKQIGIHHLNVLRNFLRKNKTFGESHNLRRHVEKTFTRSEFEALKQGDKEVVVTVSNLSLNQVEYKSVKECSYEDFCDWIWISCNYTPFMSLVRKGSCEYADGGFGSMVPIEEAIERGATEVDVIILETEVTFYNRLPSKNVFSLISNMYAYMADRIEKQNIRIGKFVAAHHGAILNFYYTPTVLTTNSLVFETEDMIKWWSSGYQFAKEQNVETSEIKGPDA